MEENLAMKVELAQYIIDVIDDSVGYIHIEDLHQNLFNQDYYIIGTYEATNWLQKYGTFQCIEMVKRYEEVNFGEVTTDFSESERIVNMVVYIVGEELINELETKTEGLLTKGIANEIKKQLKKKYF